MHTCFLFPGSFSRLGQAMQLVFSPIFGALASSELEILSSHHVFLLETSFVLRSLEVLRLINLSSNLAPALSLIKISISGPWQHPYYCI